MAPDKPRGKPRRGNDYLKPQQRGLAAQPSAEQRAEALRRQANELQIISASWEGQLPHPNDLQAYDAIVPGTAERLIGQHLREREKLVQLQISQTEHRQQLESDVTAANMRDVPRGQRYALTIVLVALLVSAFAIYNHYPWEGLGGILGSLAILAGVFVYGNERRVDELRSKWQSVLGLPNPDKGDKP
jgi:uncharacterized membrane protein